MNGPLCELQVNMIGLTLTLCNVKENSVSVVGKNIFIILVLTHQAKQTSKLKVITINCQKHAKM